jgi:Rrf2 family transcriptional regulator, iron-sulfur cluster assembly transcription factor
MLSRACGYAVRACVFLARRHDDSFVPVREIGQALDISSSFCRRSSASSPGPASSTHAGDLPAESALARAAADVNVRDIIVAIDGDALFTSCVLGLPGCGVEKPCPLHREWSRMRAEIEASFQAMTLEVLAEKSGCRDSRPAGRSQWQSASADRFIHRFERQPRHPARQGLIRVRMARTMSGTGRVASILIRSPPSSSVSSWL